MNYSLGSAQRAYDNRQPPEDAWLSEQEIIERAVEWLHKAGRAYGANVPRVGEAEGLVEDAIFELKKIGRPL